MATAEQPLFAETRKPESTQRGARAATTGEAIRLLPKLIDAWRWNHKNNINEISEQMATVLEATYPAVSKQLRKVRQMTPTPMQLPDKLLSLETARFGLEAVVLPATLRAECIELFEEHGQRRRLASFNLEPRHRILLHGPTGNGKTTLAEALAFELGVSLLRAKFCGLIDSHMGETGRNLDRIIEYASTNPCVVFMDEFDGVGVDRAAAHSGGEAGKEIQRVVNQLLISLDRLPSTCVFVAATNLPMHIDRALRRRFDLILELANPTQDLMMECALKELAVCGDSLKGQWELTNISEVISKLGLLNLAEVAALCKRIRRDLALHDGAGIASLLRSTSNKPDKEDRKR